MNFLSLDAYFAVVIILFVIVLLSAIFFYNLSSNFLKQQSLLFLTI